MLAHQSNFFRDEETYDEFSLRVAETYYTKIERSRQNKSDKIRSILNYVKKTLFSRKLRYIKYGFSDHQTYSPIQAEESLASNLHYAVQSSIDDMAKIRFNSYLGDIPKTIKAYLRRLPQRNDKVFISNLYVSLLLSIMNFVTLSGDMHLEL